MQRGYFKVVYKKGESADTYKIKEAKDALARQNDAVVKMTESSCYLFRI